MEVSEEFKTLLFTLRDSVNAMERASGGTPSDRSFLFKEGDLVKSRGVQGYKGGTSTNPLAGHIGVVREVDLMQPDGETVLVEWASPWNGHSYNPLIRRPNTGWWMHPDNLEPA